MQVYKYESTIPPSREINRETIKSDMNLAIKAREGGLTTNKNLQRILLNQKEANVYCINKN